MNRQSGFTLIEIMIALTLGLIVVGATISIYSTTVNSSANIIKSSRLNHDLESVMSLMISDIKRSGYWGGATAIVDTRTNPFTGGNDNLFISNDNSCILYGYDGNDGDGAVDNDERYGFKFENDTIRMRKTGTNNTDCTDGGWEEFIDGAQLTITSLFFSFTPIDDTVLNATSRCLNTTAAPNTVTDAQVCDGATSGDNLLVKRAVNIQLTGFLTSDPSVTKTLNGTVEVRNHRLFQEP